MAQHLSNLTGIREDTGSIPALSQWVEDPGVGHRHGSDPALLWLWCRPAASAVIHLLAWELPYAEGVSLKRRKKKNKVIPF